MNDNTSMKNNGTYVALRVKNSQQLIDFCLNQGIYPSKPEELHVTIAYSRVEFNFVPAIKLLTIAPSNLKFGLLNGCLVLFILNSIELAVEHQRTLEAGATYDYPTYEPHSTILYDADDIDIGSLAVPDFDLILGDEYVEPLDLDWVDNS